MNKATASEEEDQRFGMTGNDLKRAVHLDACGDVGGVKEKSRHDIICVMTNIVELTVIRGGA